MLSTAQLCAVGDPDAALVVDLGAQAAATKAKIASPNSGLRIDAPSPEPAETRAA
jgi:hypothetical protein